MSDRADVILTPDDLDTIGEIMNISMGSAATAVSTMLEKQVNITTPSLTQDEFGNIDSSSLEPALIVKIKYVEGIEGTNVIMLRKRDVQIILNILMGNEFGDDSEDFEFDDMSMSAACEVMNQMMGSSATALSEILGFPVNISTPEASLVETKAEVQEAFSDIDYNERVVAISFKMMIKDVVNTTFSCFLPTKLASSIVQVVNGVMNEEQIEEPVQSLISDAPVSSSGGPMNQAEIDRLMQPAPTAENPPAAPVAAQPVAQPAAVAPLQQPVPQAAPIPQAAPVPQDAPVPQAQAQQNFVPTPVYQAPEQQYAPDPHQGMQQGFAQPPAQGGDRTPMQFGTQPVQPPLQGQQWGGAPPYQQQQMQYGAPPYGYNPYMQQQPMGMQTPEFPNFGNQGMGQPVSSNFSMGLLMGVQLDVSVVIGKAKRKIKDIMDFGQGTVIELDKQTGSPAEIMVNGQLLAYGDVIVVGDNFGVRITEIVGTKELLESLDKK